MLRPGLELPVLAAAIRRCWDACSRTLPYLERAKPNHANAETGVFGRVVTRKELVGRIIGIGGSNIKGLERDTGSSPYLFSGMFNVLCGTCVGLSS